MCNMKRMTAFLMSALLMGAAVCTPAMAAEIPEGEVTEVSAEGISDSVSEEDSEPASDESIEANENEGEAAAEETENAEPSENLEENALNSETVSEDTEDAEEGLTDREIAGDFTPENSAGGETADADEEAEVKARSQENSDEIKLASDDDREGSSIENAISIYDGDEKTVYIPGNKSTNFKFIPDEEGYYTFYYHGSGYLWPRVCDADGIECDGFDEVSENGENAIRGFFEAGRVYYLCVLCFEGDSDCTVRLESTDFYATTDEWPVYCVIGGSVTLRVDAYSENALEYRWYDENRELIEGADTNIYEFIPTKAGHYTYSCEVTDGLNYKMLNPSFEVYNTIYANAVRPVIKAKPGEEVMLETEARAADGSELMYKWFDEEYNEIEGESGSSLKVTAEKNCEYHCKILALDGMEGSESDDGYEEDSLTSAEINFRIEIDSQLIVYPEGAAEKPDGSRATEVYLELDASEAVTLRPIVEGTDTDGLRFEWAKYVEDGLQGWPSEMYMELQDTSDALVLDKPEVSVYTCCVMDRYGNRYPVEFYISFGKANHLSIYPEANGMTNESGSKYLYLPCGSSGTSDIKVTVNADDSSSLNYKWYECDNWGYGEYYWNRLEENNDKKEITVENSSTSKLYKCVVTDQYGNYDYAFFEFVANNVHISSSNGELRHERIGMYEIIVQKNRGEDLTLKTIVEADNISDISYDWESYVGGDSQDNLSTTDSLVVTSDDTGTYTCRIFDNSNRADYYVHYYVEVSECAEHNYGDWTVTKEATCKETGSREKVCENCGHTVTEEIPVKDHVWEEGYTVDKEATCAEEGSESIHCSVCGEIKEGSSRAIEKTQDHSYGDWTVTKDATCTEEGSKEKTCSVCGDKITESIPANGHQWEEDYTVDKEATCTEEGSESIHCSVCDEIQEGSSRAVEKAAHTLSKTEAKEAACTENGNTAYWTCSECGKVFSDGEGTVETTLEATVIPAKGHVWEEGYTVDKEATCAEEGSKSIHCSVCGEIKEGSSRAIEKTQDHSYGDWTVTKEATCTEEGSKEKVCEVCGDKITESIPANGHQWEKEYRVDKDATCTEEGSESIHCSVCGEIQEGSSQAIEKTAHTLSKTEAKEAACTEDGNIEYWTCSECGKVFSDEEGTEEITADDTVVPAKGHTFSKTEGNKATCTEDGNIAYWTCSECGKIYSDEEGTTEIKEEDTVIRSLGHNWSDWTVTKPATETETGLREKTCSVCGEKVEEVIPVLKGTWKKNSVGWWYQWSDGSYPRDRFLDIDGKTYYFNGSGYMVTGWQKIDGSWYYFNGSGVKQTGWQRIGDTWYYFDEDGVMAADEWVGDYYFSAGGAMVTGWQKIDGSWYYFNGSGVKQTGWQRISNTWYFFDEDGVMAADEWVGNYYFSAGGAMATGWQKIDGSWYYFNGSGVKQTGWQRIGDIWYYFDEDGVMAANEWVGNYYFSAGGAMVTGWQKIDGSWYYFNGSGVKQTGWQRISNTWYFFDEDGVMATNTWIGSYYLGADGKWIPGYKPAI